MMFSKLKNVFLVNKNYFILGFLIIAILIISVFVGKWYASGKANEFAQSLHEQWRLENQAMYDTVILNAYKVQELEKQYSEQSKTIAKLKKEREQHVSSVIKEGDPKKMAGLFDNFVDSYVVSSDFGK